MHQLTFPEIEDRLGPRGANVLRRLGVSSPEGFLKLTEKQVLRLKNVGQITWDRIKAIQDDLRYSMDSSEDIGGMETAEPLDFGSSIWSALDFGTLSEKEKRIIRQCNIEYVGQFLLLNRDYVVGLSGVGLDHLVKVAARAETNY